jgi:hypothetical protein
MTKNPDLRKSVQSKEGVGKSRHFLILKVVPKYRTFGFFNRLVFTRIVIIFIYQSLWICQQSNGLCRKRLSNSLGQLPIDKVSQHERARSIHRAMKSVRQSRGSIELTRVIAHELFDIFIVVFRPLFRKHSGRNCGRHGPKHYKE